MIDFVDYGENYMKVLRISFKANKVLINFKSLEDFCIGDTVKVGTEYSNILFKITSIEVNDDSIDYEAEFESGFDMFKLYYIDGKNVTYKDFIGCPVKRVSDVIDKVFVITDSFKPIDSHYLFVLSREYHTDRVSSINAACICAEGLKDFVKTFVNKPDVVIVLATKNKTFINYFYSNCKEQFKKNIRIADI